MSTQLETFHDHLAAVIPQNTEILVVHGGIWSFAKTFGMPIRSIPQTIIKILIDILGPTKTLVMPTYTFDFPKTKFFDVKKSTPSTGVLANTFLDWPKVKRTTQPIFSYAAIGPQTEAILDCPCSTAWGSDSVMGWFERENAYFLSIGVHSLISCTYYHIAEQKCLVPYRYFKKFNGRLQKNGADIGSCTEVFYVKPLGIKMEFLAKEADDKLTIKGLKNRIFDKDQVLLESMKISDIVDTSTAVLKNDPYAMILKKQRGAVIDWIAAGNLEHEINAIPSNQKHN